MPGHGRVRRAMRPPERGCRVRKRGHGCRLIRSTLDACNGNLSKAAEQLNVARSTLPQKAAKFGIIE